MCLGIPGQVLDTRQDDLLMGRVAFGGVVREICLACTPEVHAGQYVLVHAGFAISVIDEAEAEKVFAYLEEIGDLDELGPPAGDSGPREG